MKNIVFINASPKINEESVTGFLVGLAGKFFSKSSSISSIINVRKSLTGNKKTEDFEIISRADAVIIAFPLYIFCMPGLLTRFLQDYYQYFIENRVASRNSKIYAVVNCGFPEAEINLEAARVIKSFSNHINSAFRFAILIGCGGWVLGARDAPFMKKTISRINSAFKDIAEDIQNSDCLNNKENVYIKPGIPGRLLQFIMNRMWFAGARKNGLKKKDFYRKPYLAGSL